MSEETATEFAQAVEKRKRERKSEDHVLDYHYEPSTRTATWIEGNHFMTLNGLSLILTVSSLFTFTGKSYYYCGDLSSRKLFSNARRAGLEAIEWNKGEDNPEEIVWKDWRPAEII